MTTRRSSRTLFGMATASAAMAVAALPALALAAPASAATPSVPAFQTVCEAMGGTSYPALCTLPVGSVTDGQVQALLLLCVKQAPYLAPKVPTVNGDLLWVGCYNPVP